MSVERPTVKNLLSFVIPCYRSEKTIGKVCAEIAEMMAQRPEYDYEIIAVNDGSPDGVLAVLRELASADQRIKVVDLAKNFGKHSAMMAGFSCVRGEFVVNLDDDCQCPLDGLWKLMDAITQEDYDCATAIYAEKKEAAWKRLGRRLTTVLSNILIEPPKGVRTENFFVIRRYVCDEILRYPNPYPFVNGLLLRATHRIKMIPMEERDRGDDKATGFTLKKSVSLFSNAMTAFSVKPLRIATIIGVVFAILGFAFGLYVIIRKLVHPEVLLGYSSLMAVQLFSSGVILVMLGMIGEYIGRIYISLNKSPQYVIRETINMDEEK